jgi:methionyl-tRNA formyltransferase
MGGIVIAGYSDVGYRCTKWLLDAGEKVSLIYTHPDTPGEERWWESMADLGAARGVPVLVVEDLSDPTEPVRLKALAPDFLFSFYFRTMIPPQVLAIPAKGALNMHGSLLPQFRGRAPVNWAILKGATATGASLHFMVEKPDAGDLVDQERVPIGPDDDALTVARRVGDAALTVLARSWPKLKAGTAPRVPLDLAKGSYFGGRKPEDGRIDWERPAKEIHDLVRAVTRPWPGAFTDLFGPKVTIWKTRLSPFGGHDTFPGKIEMTESSVLVYGGDDCPVEILRARPEGEKDLDAAAFSDWLLRRS